MPASRSASRPSGGLGGALDAREDLVDGAVEFALVHGGSKGCATLSRMIRALAWIALALALGACGQKGPLKLPEPPKAAGHAAP